MLDCLGPLHPNLHKPTRIHPKKSSKIFLHVRKFSDDFGMQFGFQKCAKLSVKRGKLTLTGPLPTMNNEICELDNGQTYRYWGFLRQVELIMLLASQL